MDNTLSQTGELTRAPSFPRDRVARQIQKSIETGNCVICQQKPRAVWKDTGDLRMTCGDSICFLKWMPMNTDLEIEEIQKRREKDSILGDGPVIAYR